MDEYIKREDAIKATTFIVVGELSPYEEALECTIHQNIRRIPTADVVPRAELEHYLEASGAKQVMKEAKAEVAREIFEEIEKAAASFGTIPNNNVIISLDTLAELKKKYVPDTDDANKVSSGDICVVCGEHVPEGRQICSMCETGQRFMNKRKGDDVGL